MKQHIQEALLQMSKKMAIPEFVINSNGIICLQIGSSGDLFIDIQDDMAYLYLLNTFDNVDFNLLTTALSFCQDNEDYNLLATPVLKDDNYLGFAIAIPSENITIISIEEAINQLTELSSRLQQFA